MRSKLRNSTSSFPKEGILRWGWIIVIAALLCDINSWGHQFVMDDTDYLVRNPILQDPRHIVQLFSSLYVPHSAIGQMYRPLTAFTFAINIWISGLSPDSLHPFNRLLHALTCLGFFWALKRLIPQPALLAPLTGLLFAVHPLQTEAITYITGRSDALVSMLFAFAWVFFIRFRQSPASNRKLYLLSVLFYFLALLSKESAITWLGVVLLTEFVYFSGRSFRNLLTRLRRDFFKVYISYLATTLVFLVARFGALKGSTTSISFSVENPLLEASTPVRLLTALKVMFQSIWLFLWPLPLSADYSYNQIPLLTRWTSLAAFIVLFSTLAFLVILMWSYRRLPHLFFGFGFFVVTYSIVSNLVLTIGTIRADRLIYMPSLGLCLAAATGLIYVGDLFKKGGWTHSLHLMVAIFVLLLACRTVLRNRDWRDSNTLYLQAVRTSPQSVKVRTYLGEMYARNNEPEKALEQYRVAATINPHSIELLNNVGSLLMRDGKTDEAISYFRQALAAEPNKPDVSRLNLGAALRRRGDLAGAIEQYDKIIQRSPLNAAAHFNKGNALYEVGKLSEAISEYRQALAIDPQFTNARTNLEILLRKTGTPAAPPDGHPR
ncbi:MAG: tetratricopeptide repeat protein [Terriglobia bacterium]